MIVIYYIIHVYSLLIFARVLMSWVTYDPRNPIFDTLAQITDPYLNIFRRFIPPVGMIDFSPMIALIVLQFIGRMILSVG